MARNSTRTLPTVEVALDKIVETSAAKGRQGRRASTASMPSARVACAKRGIRFLAVGSDLGFLRAGTAA